MQITKKDNSPTNVSLTISASEQDLEPIKKHVLSHFKDVKVPGFRAGRAPAHLIEKHVNQQQFFDEFMEHAINELWRRAVEQEKLRPAGQPKIEIKKFVPYTELEFETEQDVIGEVSLPNYKTIKLAKPKVEVTAKDVNEILANMQTRMAERKEVDRAAKSGDEVVIDFAGKDKDGEPVAGADGKDYPLVLGSKTFIPGFEENIVGMKPGAVKDFNVTFPKDYGVPALQNAKVTFTVTAKTVSELVEPKQDDEFAKKIGPFNSLSELKADVKKQLTAEHETKARRDYESELVQKIADKSKVEIPAAMIEEQILRLEEEEKRNLVYRGQTWDEHLKAEGVNEEEHRQRHRPEAEARVKAGLVLSAISEKEAIDVTPEELENRLAELRAQYSDPAMQAELNSPESRQDIASRILTEKTVAKLVGYASK